jgi:hypothetical protein
MTPVRHEQRQNMSKDAQLNALTAWSAHSMLDLSTHRKIMASTISTTSRYQETNTITRDYESKEVLLYLSKGEMS